MRLLRLATFAIFRNALGIDTGFTLIYIFVHYHKTFALRKIYLLYFFLSGMDCADAQSLRKPIAASYTGHGAYSIKHVDLFSATANQAALAQIKNPSFGVYGERRFLLAETNMYSSIIAIPTEEGNFAFQADYFGFKNYNESQLGIAYARSVGNKLDLGIKFNYY